MQNELIHAVQFKLQKVAINAWLPLKGRL